ncbi:MAG: hypothetical protein O3A00_01850 [Planctomycetota bacterium]|nr:hypothetical protein [Planctomycetota bacterium]
MASIHPQNLSAQISYKAVGNPPSTMPVSAISNCNPGLEFDFRAVWKSLIEGVELHEAGLTNDGHIVLDVDPDGMAHAAGVRTFDLLISVDGNKVVAEGDSPGSALEFSNALADVFDKLGSTLPCVFQSANDGSRIEVSLLINHVLDNAFVSEALAEPGQLTQGLCSPWHADYRECGCYYWAASRPDFINAVPVPGTDAVQGQSWMQRDLQSNNRPDSRPYPNFPIPDPDANPPQDEPPHFTYQEMYLQWEQKLQFIRQGKVADPQ